MSCKLITWFVFVNFKSNLWKLQFWQNSIRVCKLGRTRLWQENVDPFTRNIPYTGPLPHRRICTLLTHSYACQQNAKLQPVHSSVGFFDQFVLSVIRKLLYRCLLRCLSAVAFFGKISKPHTSRALSPLKRAEEPVLITSQTCTDTHAFVVPEHFFGSFLRLISASG